MAVKDPAYTMPVYCFIDENVKGYAKGVNHQYLINAITGELVQDMKK